MSRAFESQRYNRGELVTSFCLKLILEIMFPIVCSLQHDVDTEIMTIVTS